MDRESIHRVSSEFFAWNAICELDSMSLIEYKVYRTGGTRKTCPVALGPFPHWYKVFFQKTENVNYNQWCYLYTQAMQDFTNSIAYIIMVDLLYNLPSRQAMPHFQMKLSSFSNEKWKKKWKKWKTNNQRDIGLYQKVHSNNEWWNYLKLWFWSVYLHLKSFFNYHVFLKV